MDHMAHRGPAGNPRGHDSAGPMPAGGPFPITEDSSQIGKTPNPPQPTLAPKQPAAVKPPFLR